MASAIIDNYIAYRVLTMLVKPFVDTAAFKLGIIDAHGKNLIPAKDFTTPEQKDAYNYLTRLVFNLKKIINKLPGGESKLKNIVAAFFLFKEAYKDHRVSINEQDLIRLVQLQDQGLTFVEEQIVVDDFMLLEDAPANATGAAVSTDIPVIKKKPRRFQRFIVNDNVYNKFANGKSKYRKWASYLNLEDDGEKAIYDFAKKNPNGVIILHNGKSTKAIRFNRQGGGSWSKLKRPTKQVNNAVVS